MQKQCLTSAEGLIKMKTLLLLIGWKSGSAGRQAITPESGGLPAFFDGVDRSLKKETVST
jgi:hypothetical protein